LISQLSRETTRGGGVPWGGQFSPRNRKLSEFLWAGGVLGKGNRAQKGSRPRAPFFRHKGEQGGGGGFPGDVLGGKTNPAGGPGGATKTWAVTPSVSVLVLCGFRFRDVADFCRGPAGRPQKPRGGRVWGKKKKKGFAGEFWRGVFLGWGDGGDLLPFWAKKRKITEIQGFWGRKRFFPGGAGRPRCWLPISGGEGRRGHSISLFVGCFLFLAWL